MRCGIWKLLFIVLTSLSPLDAGQNRSAKPEKEQLRERQKTARRLFSTQQKNTNRALKQAHVPSAERSQVKHQMKREKHELRERQHQERQDLKDRRRIIKERTGHS
jgi:hypothetical protein